MNNLSDHDQFHPLLSESCELTFPTGDEPSPKPRATIYDSQLRERLYILVILLQAVAWVSLVILGSPFKNISEIQCKCSSQSVDQPLVYSPAQKILEYEVKSFTIGRDPERTIYQGLSDDVDRAWGELYNHTVMKIPKSEAVLLPNRTYPIEDEPGYYIAGLDVFHQLHCLNTIRRGLHKDYYVNDIDLDEEHISHCVDAIRQSLMCSADISVNVWQWTPHIGNVVGYSTQAHSCRHFGKLRDWARERRIHKFINVTHFMDDGLPEIPIIH